MTAAKSNGFDIMNIKPVGRTVDILHPGTKQPIGFKITFVSATDERVQRVSRKQRDLQLELSQRGKSFTTEEADANGIELLAATIVGWEFTSPDLTIEGTQPAFNTKAAIKLLTDVVWLRQQCDEVQGDRRSFFPVPV